jgi:tetratricopeptide (TPR) repeat protein
LKTSTCKYILLFTFLGVLLACSTKKNSFVNRNWHAVTTEYNVLYNGQLALDAGVTELNNTYADDFWGVLPVERMQLTEEEMGPTDAKNPNFERSETKATKAIQKHSMNIGGSEKNPQMDEAHLLLGKTRYYDNRFVPALEAFNYILYKHPNSDKIYEAKVWREKTNLRLENEAIAIKNLKQLIKEKELEPQVFADANATLAQAYITTQATDSAVTALKKAVQFTELKEERARYTFILGQLYEKQNYKDSAYAAFQEVIDMKRQSPRRYVIQAHARQAAQFDFAKGDTLAFMEKYRDLLEDRENRPYLDALNHQVALFYDRQDKDGEAVKYYKKSLLTKSKDKYLMASNHRNIAEINFKEARYQAAGMYYDSTLVYLNNKTREYSAIKKKRDNLADVIKYEGIAQNNDSILRLVALSGPDRITFFEDYIAKLKEKDELERIRLEEEAIRQENLSRMQDGSEDPMRAGEFSGAPQSMQASRQRGGDDVSSKRADVATAATRTPGPIASSVSGGDSKFYFYNPSTVSFGKIEFRKRWGNRAYSENWRWSSEQRNRNTATDETGGDDPVADAGAGTAAGPEKSDERYNPEFYIKQLPTSQVVLDSLAKDRNFAYYQLGTIYKEKFKEYQRAADKLEKLLVNNPEERLILPANYNLYKIYEIIDPAKAAAYKQKILSQYPDSRYAEIIRNPQSETVNTGSPDAVYAALFKKYESGEFREVLAQSETYVETYTGEDIVSKFEMLKASTSGRLKGLEDYKQALNFVALNYPNSEEGKRAEAILKTDIPNLEKLAFGQPAQSWKVIFKFDNPNDPKIKPLTDKINKFIKDGLNNSITVSNDIYTLGENFIVIHGFNSKLAAVDAVTILKDYKAYKVTETPVIISSEDYKVVQIKKNLTQYVALK